MNPPSDPPSRPPGPDTGYTLSRTANDWEAITLAISGEIDLSNADRFEEELHRIVNGTEHQLILDLHGCSFIDSTAIRVLVKIAHDQRERGRTLGLSRLGHEPKRYLEIAGLLESDLFLNYPELPPSRK